MTRDMQKKFRGLSEETRAEIKGKFTFDGDDDRFIAYVKQQGLGMTVMWLIIDPTNPVDPRFLC